MNRPVRIAVHRARIGYLTGSFDRFGPDHAALLRQAQFACDHLVVGVLSDVMLAVRGEWPEWSLAQRLDAVRRSRFVHDALPQHDDDLENVWRRTRFDILFTAVDDVTEDRGLALEYDVRILGSTVVPLPSARVGG